MVEIGSALGQVEERWRIKVITRYNIDPDAIIAKKSYKAHDIKSLLVGRNVSNNEIKEYFREYLKSKGLWERVLSVRLKTT